MDDHVDDYNITTPNGQGDWPNWMPFEFLKIDYETGNSRALMEALLKCSLLKLPMPEWVAEAYQDGYRKVTTYQVRSWDDAFGIPHPKGTDLKANRKKLQIGGKIFQAAREMIESGTPTDLALFELIGTQFNVSCSYARDAYYEHLNRLKDAEKSAAFFRLQAARLDALGKIREEHVPNNDGNTLVQSDPNDSE